MKKRQGGGFVLGLIVGLLTGLAIALGVALYVTKVPIPFVNKVPHRASSERDAAESERNRNWDPNAPLHGSNPARPGAPAAPPATATEADAKPTVAGVDRPASTVTSVDVAAKPAPDTAPTVVSTVRNPPVTASPAEPPVISGNTNRQAAAIFSDRPAPAEPALSTRSRDDPFIYFVQAGAYGRPEDAEQQRAKLAMLGLESRITEREQAGRTVYRVRMGPFDKRERADETKSRLAAASMDGVLVRVQK